VGWFYGVIFAAPWFLLGFDRFIRGLDLIRLGHSDILVLVSLLFLPVTAGVIVGGRIWVTQAESSARPGAVLLSLAMGAGWLFLLTGTGLVLARIFDGHWASIPLREWFKYLFGWMVLSIYALLQGAIIRWRIRKLHPGILES
jgi:hypothetical protein